MLAVVTGAATASARHNVVHVVFDDLRSELGAYGAVGAVTPNLDRLAASGTVFDRAYAQQAVCGPSRNSFLSGRRPDRSRSWNFIVSLKHEPRPAPARAA
jgi:arylsulfatase A-like enzyme